jgi:hypothetical protein
MNLAMMVAFVKEAVTVDDLYRKTTSAPGVDINPQSLDRMVANAQGGAVTNPTSRQMPEAFGQAPTTVGMRKLRSVADRIPHRLARDFSHGLKPFTEAPRIPKKDGGKILVNPEAIQKVLPAYRGTSELVSPEARRGLTALVTSHELAERRVAPKDIRRFQSHFAPEVLLKERNAIARLEGPGGREAAEMLAKTREATGEAQHMRNLLTRAYGPRAAQFLEGNEKVPKALLRGLRRKLRADPSMLYAADPAKSMGVLDKLKAAPGSIATQRRVSNVIKNLT